MRRFLFLTLLSPAGCVCLLCCGPFRQSMSMATNFKTIYSFRFDNFYKNIQVISAVLMKRSTANSRKTLTRTNGDSDFVRVPVAERFVPKELAAIWISAF